MKYIAALAILFILATPCVAQVEFKVEESERTVILPFERNFIFKIEFTTTGEDEAVVTFVSPPVQNPEWLVILPTGRLALQPGETVEIVATFEPTVKPEPGKSGELSYTFKFEANGKTYEVPVKVRYEVVDLTSIPKEKIVVRVFDEREPVREAEVSLLYPGAMFGENRPTDASGKAEFLVPSREYVRDVFERYNLSSPDYYYLEVSKPGYENFYSVIESNEVTVHLKPSGNTSSSKRSAR